MLGNLGAVDTLPEDNVCTAVVGIARTALVAIGPSDQSYYNYGLMGAETMLLEHLLRHARCDHQFLFCATMLACLTAIRS